MSEFEPDASASEEAASDVGADLECKPRRPIWQRVLRGLGITLASLLVILVVGGVLLYNFGGMSGSAVPGVLERYDQMVAAGQAQPIQKRFVIPIPGCQCHSKDPSLTAQHTRRRMNECSHCHSSKPAHMEPGYL